MMSLGQTYGTGLGEYADQVLGGFSGWSAAQRCQNQNCLLIRTKTPTLKDDICCWVYTMNPSECHSPMDIRVRSGTPAMCVTMAPPEQREYVPKSSGENLILAAPNWRVSALMSEIMFEALTELIP